MIHTVRTKATHGFSLVEVLVSLAILMAGIVTIINFFPMTLKASNHSIYLSKAVVLAQLKAEELRRDTAAGTTLISNILAMTAPTPQLQFPSEPNLTYSFCGVSLIDPVDDPDDPRDDAGVARVIIRYHTSYRSTNDVLYELRFSE